LTFSPKIKNSGEKSGVENAPSGGEGPVLKSAASFVPAPANREAGLRRRD
jgi:hypothetical protein